MLQEEANRWTFNSGLGNCWVLMARDPSVLNTPGLLHYERPVAPDPKKSVLCTISAIRSVFFGLSDCQSKFPTAASPFSSSNL
jgi:hypothetical protein